MPQLNVALLPDGRKAIIMRTSDSIGFKKCRRSWSWSSHLLGNLGPSWLASPLWFGSAIHYALEDFHGFKSFETASDAFRAYCIATSKQHIRDLPNDAEELFQLGTKMMDYYETGWLSTRKADATYWEVDPHTGDEVPQVEVNFEIEVPLDEHPLLRAYAEAQGADCVLYRGTIDRVGIDEFGRLWCIEYKSAKVAEHMHYQTDPQVSRYIWAMQHIYPGMEIAGVIYMQFIKKAPELPRILASGLVSTASNLTTSSVLYRRQLEALYGTVGMAPPGNRDFLTNLYTQEDEHKDKYIIREYVHRNKHQSEAEAQKILLELEDMLNPDLPLYPNPTRDCSRMCSFLAACVSFDDGSDHQSVLDAGFSQRDQAADRLWRRRMPDPSKLVELRESRMTPDLTDMQIRLQSLPEAERDRIVAGDNTIPFTFNIDTD